MYSSILIYDIVSWSFVLLVWINKVTKVINSFSGEQVQMFPLKHGGIEA